MKCVVSSWIYTVSYSTGYNNNENTALLMVYVSETFDYTSAGLRVLSLLKSNTAAYFLEGFVCADTCIYFSIFPPPHISKLGAYCLSVGLHKLNVKTKHFAFTPKLTRLIFGMKTRLIDRHLVVSRSNTEVTLSKNGCFRTHCVSQTQLVYPFTTVFSKDT